jgi:hypothetical protein
VRQARIKQTPLLNVSGADFDEWKLYMTTFLEGSEASFPDIVKLDSICSHYLGVDIDLMHGPTHGLTCGCLFNFGEPVS